MIISKMAFWIPLISFGILIDGLDIIPENFQNITTICEVVKKNGGEI